MNNSFGPLDSPTHQISATASIVAPMVNEE